MKWQWFPVIFFSISAIFAAGFGAGRYKNFNLKPVQVDGALIFLVAFAGGLSTAFGSDAAFSYVNAHCVFWMRTMCGAFGVGGAALVAFRSKVFARYSDALPNPTGAAPAGTIEKSIVTTETQTNVAGPVTDDKTPPVTGK